MAKTYKYNLRGGSKKDQCPSCGKFAFKPYVDANGNIAGEQYGRCERVNSCGYLEYPKSSGEIDIYIPTVRNEPKPTDFIDLDTANRTFIDFNSNVFLLYLASKFGAEAALKLQSTYNIGTAKNKGTIFWQKDYEGRFRTGKVFYYNYDGKRNKDKGSWYAHKKIKEDYVLKQVFFGEHLLKEYPDHPVALCESEKTAVIMSVIRPEFIWLASGGSQMLSVDRFRHLHSRNITVFPDEGEFKSWKEKTAFINDRKMNTEVEERFLNKECNKGSDILDIINY